MGKTEVMARQNRDAHVRQLHQRLIERDPLAPSDLVETLMDELVRRVRAKAHTTSNDVLVYDAVTDALLAYAQQPTKYSPAKSGLLTYLTMSAYGDYLNMVARERRRKTREVPFENVEHRLHDGNNWMADVEDTIMERHGVFTPHERSRLLQRVSEEFPDPQDRKLLNLMLLGERKTAAYSAVLGIQAFDHDEQRGVVKRHKDRLTKRLERLGGKLREQ